MVKTRLRPAVVMAAMVLSVAPLHGATDPSSGPVAVADQFVHAQAGFDVDALRRLTAENYMEVSPVGDVDPRDKMLGFYAPANKMDGVTVVFSEPSARISDDTAIVIALIDFSFKERDGSMRRNAMRGTFVEERFGDDWKLLSTQFTPYHPAGKSQSHG